MKNMLTTKELAERWGFKEQSIRKLRMKKQGPPYIKIGNNILYKLEEIIKYEERNTVAPGKNHE